ncbi:hypothetical protein [Pseudoxanthomonas mexicana]|uniref:hypothetical protein n=1 Tax=Pseudoxanthomonas mexicana TaxID=128785 RepID=UPI00209D8E28|nr:hypothetical protein [Pseudoxanthomonas mexicana]MCP1585416.1 hypothetical protein [Pseudoxanthomonas mexicana]
MNLVRSVVEKHTSSLSLMERVYSEELPNPGGIAKELGPNGVAELFSEIAEISNERDRLDREGEVNCDDLDDFWRAMTRLGSVIPYQARLYPAQVLEGLSHENRSVRFYVAHSLSKVPFRKALLKLQKALSMESDSLTRRVLTEAVTACSSIMACLREIVAKNRRLPVVWRDA